MSARSLHPVIVVIAHLNPFRRQVFRRPAPLPPFLPSDARDSPRAELIDQCGRSQRQKLVWNGEPFGLDPVGRRDALGAEALEVLDGVFRGIDQKLANNLNSFIIGDMDGGGVVVRLAMDVLGTCVVSGGSGVSPPAEALWAEQMATHMREEGRDDSWREGHTQCDHVQRHCESIVADNGSSTMGHLIGEGRSWGIYYRRREAEPQSIEGWG